MRGSTTAWGDAARRQSIGHVGPPFGVGIGSAFGVNRVWGADVARVGVRSKRVNPMRRWFVESPCQSDRSGRIRLLWPVGCALARGADDCSPVGALLWLAGCSPP
jgi:hypothetical protein